MACQTDLVFPLIADIYYPDVDVAAYGNVKKQWIFGKSVACYFSKKTNDQQNDINTQPQITMDFILTGRVKEDIRFASEINKQSLSNILITNIRTPDDTEIFTETSGPRTSKSTLFEISSYEPYLGPFNNIEYYVLKIKRSENQSGNI